MNAFVNEFHYDNAGADADEFVDLAGLAGLDPTGWSLVLYNGNGGAPYATIPLGGTFLDEANGFGFLSFSTPGLQNGAPDGIALVDGGGAVVEFLSYEGAFTAVGGAADGLTSTDVGVDEPGTTPLGQSLQRIGTGSQAADFTFAAPQVATEGAVNAGQTFVAPGGTEGAFTLELLHFADQEAAVAAIEDAPRLSAVVAALRAQDLGAKGEPDNTLFLSSGDAFIPVARSQEIFPLPRPRPRTAVWG